ncbi:hypothetical protein SAMN02745883_02245 [Caminicella sporogenes DSM 14501]|uniref:Uncharacterized protein n=1 Tax=Caminicella sporogenes DSM 14501 TaxID=1121266 RepID=A0A1M6T5Y6_9FIRM|nr:hypothetical protein [Caminicella sporogenes]RKD26095.1 hypothetical protein BET04_11120 [Caminicella sporogenes]SHK52462.1 hypothetical protein SAMN02745883_02245 [Caminicella sporogenes DSM 14501]
MSNNMFQQILEKLNSMDKKLSNLGTDVNTLKTDVSSLKDDVYILKTDVSFLKDNVDVLKTDTNNLKAGQERIEIKLDTVYVQTANLTEFKTETQTILNKVSNDLDFLTYKESQNEKELFNIKKNLQIVK